MPSSFAQSNEVLSLSSSLEAIRPQLKPPVGNAMLFDDHFKVMAVGGPNQRKDFHIETGAEVFYQVDGPMEVVVFHPQLQRTVPVRIEAGELFYLPPGVPHSPQRFPQTLGIVYERRRSDDDTHPEFDALCWYDEEDHSVLYAEYFYCHSLGSQVKEAIGRYQSHQSNPQPLPAIPPEAQGLLDCIEKAKAIPLPKPFNLSKALSRLPLNTLSRLPLLYYGDEESTPTVSPHELETEFVVQVCKGHHCARIALPAMIREFYLWQWTGHATVTVGPETSFTLQAGDVLLLKEVLDGLPITEIEVCTEHEHDVLLINTNHAAQP